MCCVLAYANVWLSEVNWIRKWKFSEIRMTLTTTNTWRDAVAVCRTHSRISCWNNKKMNKCWLIHWLDWYFHGLYETNANKHLLIRLMGMLSLRDQRENAVSVKKMAQPNVDDSICRNMLFFQKKKGKNPFNQKKVNDKTTVLKEKDLSTFARNWKSIYRLTGKKGSYDFQKLETMLIMRWFGFDHLSKSIWNRFHYGRHVECLLLVCIRIHCCCDVVSIRIDCRANSGFHWLLASASALALASAKW